MQFISFEFVQRIRRYRALSVVLGAMVFACSNEPAHQETAAVSDALKTPDELLASFPPPDGCSELVGVALVPGDVVGVGLDNVLATVCYPDPWDTEDPAPPDLAFINPSDGTIASSVDIDGPERWDAIDYRADRGDLVARSDMSVYRIGLEEDLGTAELLFDIPELFPDVDGVDSEFENATGIAWDEVNQGIELITWVIYVGGDEPNRSELQRFTEAGERLARIDLPDDMTACLTTPLRGDSSIAATGSQRLITCSRLIPADPIAVHNVLSIDLEEGVWRDLEGAIFEVVGFYGRARGDLACDRNTFAGDVAVWISSPFQQQALVALPIAGNLCDDSAGPPPAPDTSVVSFEIPEECNGGTSDQARLSRGLATVPGDLVGSDVALLVAVPCAASNEIQMYDPLTGSLEVALSLSEPLALWSLAFRGDRADLIGIDATAPFEAGSRIVRISLANLSDSDESTAGDVQELFEFAPSFAADPEWPTAIGWHADDNEIYVVAEQSVTPQEDAKLYRYTETGEESASQQLGLSLCDSPESFASGLIVSGSSLRATCSRGSAESVLFSAYPDLREDNARLFRVDPETGSADESSAESLATLTRDLECDSLTFRDSGLTVAWTLSQSGDVARAFEVPPGDCDAGGGAADDGLVRGFADPTTGSAPPELAAICQLITLAPLDDLDEDGILDCFEILGGVDGDKDGTLDYYFPPDMLPTVGVQDIYVEIDYMEGVEPIAESIARVQQAFAASPPPADNLLILQRKLHVLVDEQVPAAPLVAWEGVTGDSDDPPPPPDVPDFRDIKRDHFGTADERGPFGDPTFLNPTLNAKATFFRYSLWTFDLHNEPSSVRGIAETGGDDFVVAVGAYPIASRANDIADMDAGTFMHELGHTLGLRHGGYDDVNHKPNYISVMNYSLVYLHYARNRILDYSRQELPSISELGLVEAAGVSGPAGYTTVFFSNCTENVETTDPSRCSATQIKEVPADQPIDYDRSGDISLDPYDIPFSVNNDLKYEPFLIGHDDWSNIDVEFRDSFWYSRSMSFASADERNSLLDGDPDDDGVPNYADNCALLANADQSDADEDGEGDACQCERVAAEPAATNGVEVRYRSSDYSPQDNHVRPHFEIVNTGSTPLPLSEVSVRYYFTNEASAPLQFWVDFSPVAGPIEGQFVRPAEARQNSDTYLEVTFPGNSVVLAPGQSTGVIQTRFNAQNWSSFDESDDFSYAFAEQTQASPDVVALRNGTIVWGKEPAFAYCEGGPLSVGVSLEASYRSGNQGGVYTQHMRPQFIIENTGVVDVPLDRVTVRYWFTADGRTPQFALDYAALGYENVNGQIVAMSAPVAGADHYLELSFSGGVLLGAADTGEIYARIHDAAWWFFNESNDYSFGGTTYQQSETTTVYFDGVLIWGEEP